MDSYRLRAKINKESDNKLSQFKKRNFRQNANPSRIP